ncbi:MAG TPA: histidine kinase [Acidimicrobiales bacterium]|nr:histidine kinase [Acidimicrobiales bacterium]
MFSHVLGRADSPRTPVLSHRPARHPLATDAAIGVGVAAVWLVVFEIGKRTGWRPVDPRAWVIAGACLGLAVAVRRVGGVGLFVLLALAYPLVYGRPLLSYFHLLPLLVLGFAGAQMGGRRHRVVLVVGACAVSVAILLSPLMTPRLWSPDRPGFEPPGPRPRINLSDLALAEFATVSVALLGAAIASQRAAARDLADRNEELERLRRSEADRAVAEERLRISREVHDLVAHHLTAILMRAQAADRVRDSRPDEAQRAVAWIADESREALRSTRLTVSTLREAASAAPGDRDDGPLADDLAQMVERVRQVGLHARLEARWDAEPRLSPSAGVAVRRTVQEALTNVLKHAHATDALVLLRPDGGGLSTWVLDNGRATAPPGPPVPGSGAGLTGMSERALACGGRVDHGPAPDGGWQVHLWVPILIGGER